MKVLGVDLGKVRIGIAVMDWDSGIVTPRPPVSAIGTLTKDAALIDELGKREEVEKIVLGLPLENGEESKMSTVVRRFGSILNDFGWEVGYADESLTSYEADTAMLEAGMKASLRKKRLDSEAACGILERFKRSE